MKCVRIFAHHKTPMQVQRLWKTRETKALKLKYATLEKQSTCQKRSRRTGQQNRIIDRSLMRDP